MNTQIKIVSFLFVIYLVLISSIFSFYADSLKTYNKKLNSTENKINGVVYLDLLHKLSANVVAYQGCLVLYDRVVETNETIENIKENIDNIYVFLDINKEFKNIALDKHLTNILEFNMKYEDYYHFFDYLNNEFYKIGNSSELLFSQDKERYFLGTLVTHYVPEFFISLGISNNILKEYNQNKYLTSDRKSIFIEHNKLVHLSSEELNNIISLLNEYKDTKVLHSVNQQIFNILNQLKDRKALNKDYEIIDKYLKQGEKLLTLAEELSYQNIKLLQNLLTSDRLEYKNKIAFYQLLIIFMIILVTSIFIYFYRVLSLSIQKDKKLEEFNASLLQRVNLEVTKNREKDKQLIQQSRLAQMGEMISMIAHQWRQPLSAISATSASLELKATLGKVNNEIVISSAESISKYSQHLSSTIDDFRDFFKSNKEATETKYIPIIESVLKIIEVSLVNKNIKIDTIFNSNNIFLTYSNEIKQVLLNLIKNAEDVLIENSISNPTITIRTDKNSLIVSDNAGGIPDEIIENIFDPYFSTKSSKNGTGLGLYMSKTIIEEHCAGELRAYNNDVGAVFEIILKEVDV